MSTPLIASAARTADFNSEGFVPSSPKFYIAVEVEAIVTAPSVVMNLQIHNSSHTNWYTIDLIAAALTAVNTFLYYFTNSEDPTAAVQGVTEVFEVHCAGIECRLFMDHANANSITYTAAIMQVSEKQEV